MSWSRWLFLCSLCVLTACSRGGTVDFPPLSFKQYQPIFMAVSSVEFVEEYKSPRRPPHVEHLIPYSPTDAMKIWTRQRLKAAGGNKTMRVIIKDGSVKAIDLSQPLSWKNVFSVNLDKRYEAKLDVALRIYGESPIAEANVEITANKVIVLNDNATANERQAAYRAMIADLMRGVNAELEKNIYQYMGEYISYSMSP